MLGHQKRMALLKTVQRWFRLGKSDPEELARERIRALEGDDDTEGGAQIQEDKPQSLEGQNGSLRGVDQLG